MFRATSRIFVLLTASLCCFGAAVLATECREGICIRLRSRGVSTQRYLHDVTEPNVRLEVLTWWWLLRCSHTFEPQPGPGSSLFVLAGSHECSRSTVVPPCVGLLSAVQVPAPQASPGSKACTADFFIMGPSCARAAAPPCSARLDHQYHSCFYSAGTHGNSNTWSTSKAATADLSHRISCFAGCGGGWRLCQRFLARLWCAMCGRSKCNRDPAAAGRDCLGGMQLPLSSCAPVANACHTIQHRSGHTLANFCQIAYLLQLPACVIINWRCCAYAKNTL